MDIPATSDNIPGTLVLRDASGFFSGGNSAVGGGTDRVFYENDQTVNTNYTITTNKNAMSAGPVTVANGITVTVPNGSTWTVV